MWIFSTNYLCCVYVHMNFFLMCRLSTWMSPQLEWTPTPEDTYGMSWRRKKRTSWSFWQLILWMKQIYWQVCIQLVLLFTGKYFSCLFFAPLTPIISGRIWDRASYYLLNYYSWIKYKLVWANLRLGKKWKGRNNPVYIMLNAVSYLFLYDEGEGGFTVDCLRFPPG